MTSHDPPPSSPRRRRSKGTRPAVPSKPVPEKFSEAVPNQTTGNESHRAWTGVRQRSRRHICPKCGGPFVRMHRRFGDRMLSIFNPVRRYGCANHLCAHEAILRKSSTFAQRPIVAVGAVIGAALAGALVTALGLYAASDATTRAEVRDAYTSVLQPDVVDPPDATPARPASRQLPDPKYETASTLEMNPETGDLEVEFLPRVPALRPAANAPALEQRRPLE